MTSGPQGLTVRQEPDRVVLQWSGPVQAPMSDRFRDAFRELENDPRRLVISLNSGGGEVEHGHAVIREIRAASRERQIDTMIEAGKMCASMCVPIYLVGAERIASPTARFMFHEALFRVRPAPERERRDLKKPTPKATTTYVRNAATTRITDELFDEDMGPRSVDARWLRDMRAKIRSRDVWLTGRELVNQGSGVVDKLQ